MTNPASDAAADGGKRGYEIAREALEEARANARAQGRDVGAGRHAPIRTGRRRRRGGWTGPGDDPWDPQPLGSLMRNVSLRKGWSEKVSTGRLFAEWPSIVGPEIAAHATPEKLEEGILYIRAESTAWATQLRLYAGDILRKTSATMGRGQIRRIKVHGPEAPSWRKGPLHVRGRGPRDTYG